MTLEVVEQQIQAVGLPPFHIFGQNTVWGVRQAQEPLPGVGLSLGAYDGVVRLVLGHRAPHIHGAECQIDIVHIQSVDLAHTHSCAEH